MLCPKKREHKWNEKNRKQKRAKSKNHVVNSVDNNNNNNDDDDDDDNVSYDVLRVNYRCECLVNLFFCPLRSFHDTSGNFTNATLVDFFLLLTVMMLISGANTILLLVISVLPYLICISTLRSRRAIGCSWYETAQSQWHPFQPDSYFLKMASENNQCRDFLTFSQRHHHLTHVYLQLLWFGCTPTED